MIQSKTVVETVLSGLSNFRGKQHWSNNKILMSNISVWGNDP